MMATIPSSEYQRTYKKRHGWRSGIGQLCVIRFFSKSSIWTLILLGK